MTRKRDIARPYPPDYCDAETLAYRLGLARDTVHDWSRRGLLPKPLDIGTERRWRWSDVEAWIAAHNGEGLDSGDSGPLPSDDPFSRGIMNAKASPHAAS